MTLCNQTPLENLQHHMGNDLLVMSGIWRGIMDAGKRPDLKTLKEIYRRCGLIQRSIIQYMRVEDVKAH